MKKSEIILLYKSIINIFNKNFPGAKFSYCLKRNIDLLLPEVEAIDKAKLSSPEYMEYEQKRIDLVKNYAQKDENGEPIVKDNEFQGVDFNNPDFVEKYSKLNKEYEKPLKEINELMDQESDVQLYKLNINDVPNELESLELNKIYSIISE